MNELQAKHDEVDRRLAGLKRTRKLFWAICLTFFAMGAGVGVLVASEVIDPVTVTTRCGGITV